MLPYWFQLLWLLTNKHSTFKEISTEATRPFIGMTNGPWIWWQHAQRIHRLRSKLHPFHRNQDLFCSNLPYLLHKLWPTAGMWHSQPPDTPRHYAAIYHYRGRCWTWLVCKGSWHLSCQYLVWESSNLWWQKCQAYGFPLGSLVWQRTRLLLRILPSTPA